MTPKKKIKYGQQQRRIIPGLSIGRRSTKKVGEGYSLDFVIFAANYAEDSLGIFRRYHDEYDKQEDVLE